MGNAATGLGAPRLDVDPVLSGAGDQIRFDKEQTLWPRTIAIGFETGGTIPLQDHDVIDPRPIGTFRAGLIFREQVDPRQFRSFAQEREFDRHRAAFARSQNVRRFGDGPFDRCGRRDEQLGNIVDQEQQPMRVQLAADAVLEADYASSGRGRTEVRWRRAVNRGRLLGQPCRALQRQRHRAIRCGRGE